MNSNYLFSDDLFKVQSGLATVILDINLHVIKCNKEFLKISGLSIRNVIHKHWHDLIIYDYPYTPLENAEIFSNLNAIPSGKFWCSIKDKNPRKLISATISYNTELSCYYATFYDISDQLGPDRLLHDGGLMIGSIADNLKGAMAFHDRMGIIKLASSEICKMAGVEKNEILGKNIREFFDSKIVDKWLYWMNNKPDLLPPYLEFDSLKNNDKIFHVIASPKLFFDLNKRVVGCMFMFSDITELKNNEQRLRISDEKYSKAFHASPAPSSITTLNEGRYVDVNESYTKLVGYSKEELIGKTSTDIKFFTVQEDRTKFINELTKTGKLRNYETQMFSKIAGIRTVSMTAEIIELQSAKCIIWVANDITERIQLEKEVLTAASQERYKIGQYLHDDLGQHLVGIEAMCSLLLKRLKNQNNSEAKIAEEIHEYLKEAHEKARVTARDLCPVRLEENGLSFAITDLITKTEKIFGINCIFHNFNMSVRIYNSQVAINIFYIIQEAVNNAVKHGKVQNIIITYSSNEDNIYISIEDDGVGFDASQPSSAGMGLGLMKYRARAIGGALEISSTPGKGTEILIKFPRISNKKSEWDWKEKTYEEITNIYS
ncbi:MAG TPA: PAS domain S-box protein [Spirochaetota bacterium]|nr:PAS domain S-box protein [Spirochaetota bacterium]HPS86913.1 PAS domain S-box protein [Spirochaetota bacterium]